MEEKVESLQDTSCENGGDLKQVSEAQDAITKNEKTPVLSKNQMKKLAKKKIFLELRPQKRKEEKRKRAEKKKKLREMVEQGLIEPPPYEEGSKRTKTMSDPDASLLSVVIDLSFDHLMQEKEILKLIKQIQRCYSSNRRAVHPLQLYLTSFGGQCKQVLESKTQNYRSWDVHFRNESYMNVFEKTKVVYLTAESPNVLSEMDISKVYVIGGLVDHNSQKGLCHRLAVEQGFDHAQLPIDQFIKLDSRKVLTVNHVFEIILNYMESGSWQEAFFKVIPPRKGVTLKEQSIKSLETDGSGHKDNDGSTVGRSDQHTGGEGKYKNLEESESTELKDSLVNNEKTEHCRCEEGCKNTSETLTNISEGNTQELNIKRLPNDELNSLHEIGLQEDSSKS